jgi:putative transposase
MPRKNRREVLYDGCYCHVYSRALEKRFIFQDAEDFELFKGFVLQSKSKYRFQIYHYCLMNTHFHLLVRLSRLDDFSLALRDIKQSYADAYRRKYRKKGPVWWGRFGSQLIEDERYLYACGLYIEMNPVTAGMVVRAEDWHYSSSQHYFLERSDEMIDHYNQPKKEVAECLKVGLNVGRGSYIGTPNFILDYGKKS